MKTPRTKRTSTASLAEKERALAAAEFFAGGEAYDEFCVEMKAGPYPFRERVFPVRVTESTYRLLHTWDKAGLLDPRGKVGRSRGGWRRFSVFDIARLRIFSALRQFGVPLQKVRTVNIGIAVRNLSDDDTLADLPACEGFFLHYQWIQAMLGRDPILAVFEDGTIGGGTRDQYLAAMDAKRWPQHIALSLTPIFRGIFADLGGRFDESHAHSVAITPEELHILSLIRTGRYDTVNVVLKAGRPVLLKLDERAPIPKGTLRQREQFIATLQRSAAAFEDLRIVTTNGRPTMVRRTRSVRP